MAVSPDVIRKDLLTDKDLQIADELERFIDEQLELYRDYQDEEVLCCRKMKDGSLAVDLNESIPKRILSELKERYLESGWYDLRYLIEKNKHLTEKDPREKIYYIILVPPPIPALSSSPNPKNPKRGFVYLFHAENGLYKIGRSKNPKKRMDKMAGAIMPFKIESIHSIACKDSHQAEKELHNKYAHLRVTGEWFKLADQEIEEIKAISVM